MTVFTRNRILCGSLLTALTLSATLLYAGEDESFPGRTLVLTAGRDNQDNQLLDAALLVPVNELVMLDAGIGANRINDVDTAFTTNDAWLGVGSTQASGFNVHLGARAWGEEQTIETTDYSAELSYQSAGGWRNSLMFERGDVTLYIDPMFSNRLTALNTGRRAWGITSGYTGDTGGGWLSWIRRDYERDLTLLNSNPVLQTVIKSFALDQAYALSSDEYNLGYEWYFETYDIGVQYSRVVSVVDAAAVDYALITGRYYVGDTTSLQASIQNSLDDDLTSLSVGLGLLF